MVIQSATPTTMSTLLKQQLLVLLSVYTCCCAPLTITQATNQQQDHFLHQTRSFSRPKLRTEQVNFENNIALNHNDNDIINNDRYNAGDGSRVSRQRNNNDSKKRSRHTIRRHFVTQMPIEPFTLDDEVDDDNIEQDSTYIDYNSKQFNKNGEYDDDDDDSDDNNEYAINNSYDISRHRLHKPSSYLASTQSVNVLGSADIPNQMSVGQTEQTLQTVTTTLDAQTIDASAASPSPSSLLPFSVHHPAQPAQPMSMSSSQQPPFPSSSSGTIPALDATQTFVPIDSNSQPQVNPLASLGGLPVPQTSAMDLSAPGFDPSSQQPQVVPQVAAFDPNFVEPSLVDPTAVTAAAIVPANPTSAPIDPLTGLPQQAPPAGAIGDVINPLLVPTIVGTNPADLSAAGIVQQTDQISEQDFTAEFGDDLAKGGQPTSIKDALNKFYKAGKSKGLLDDFTSSGVLIDPNGNLVRTDVAKDVEVIDFGATYPKPSDPRIHLLNYPLIFPEISLLNITKADLKKNPSLMFFDFDVTFVYVSTKPCFVKLKLFDLITNHVIADAEANLKANPKDSSLTYTMLTSIDLSQDALFDDDGSSQYGIVLTITPIDRHLNKYSPSDFRQVDIRDDIKHVIYNNDDPFDEPSNQAPGTYGRATELQLQVDLVSNLVFIPEHQRKKIEKKHNKNKKKHKKSVKAISSTKASKKDRKAAADGLSTATKPASTIPTTTTTTTPAGATPGVVAGTAPAVGATPVTTAGTPKPVTAGKKPPKGSKVPKTATVATVPKVAAAVIGPDLGSTGLGGVAISDAVTADADVEDDDVFEPYSEEFPTNPYWVGAEIDIFNVPLFGFKPNYHIGVPFYMQWWGRYEAFIIGGIVLVVMAGAALCVAQHQITTRNKHKLIFAQQKLQELEQAQLVAAKVAAESDADNTVTFVKSSSGQQPDVAVNINSR